MLERFMQKVLPEPNSGCWLWDAHVSKEGYGRFGVGRVAHEAHRISYKMFCGEIPKGLCVDHKCFVRSCVNPAHLRLLTRAENTRNQRHAGRNKTCCKNGHLLVFRNSARVCKTCQAAASAKYRRSKK